MDMTYQAVFASSATMGLTLATSPLSSGLADERSIPTQGERKPFPIRKGLLTVRRILLNDFAITNRKEHHGEEIFRA